MACKVNDSNIQDVIELISSEGFDGMAQAMGILMNVAMRLERDRHLGADPYERSVDRLGYANGYKPKKFKTRAGEVELAIPQTRGTEFYPSSLERGCRSEKALKLALSEMYIQGVSTRKVKAITEQLCGFEISSQEVSRATKALDEELQAWRKRSLGRMLYLIVDARYEKVRRNGTVSDSSVLIAHGIDEEGRRRVLGVSVSLSESEVHWRGFFDGLVSRGLHGLKLIVSDAHSGLKAARQAVFPSVPWQRCQFHLQQNAQAYVPKKSMKSAVALDIRSILNAPDRMEADRLLGKMVEKYKSNAPELSIWMESNIPESLEVMSLPQPHWKKLRTSNMAERVNKEVKRRTKVVGIFPNVDACLRLCTAMLVEQDEEWQEGRTYLNMDTSN